jgi:hypothetical protein
MVSMPHPRDSGMIMNSLDAFLMGTVRATVIRPTGFHTVANYFAPAVLALRSQCMDGAFEAVKHMRDAVDQDLDRLVIVIATDFAFFHNIAPSGLGGGWVGPGIELRVPRIVWV